MSRRPPGVAAYVINGLAEREKRQCSNYTLTAPKRKKPFSKGADIAERTISPCFLGRRPHLPRVVTPLNVFVRHGSAVSERARTKGQRRYVREREGVCKKKKRKKRTCREVANVKIAYATSSKSSFIMVLFFYFFAFKNARWSFKE